LLARRKPFNAGFSIDIAANLSAHSALALDGGRKIAGPASGIRIGSAGLIKQGLVLDALRSISNQFRWIFGRRKASW
jgi:hypothetical protein